ncbi:MAG TPA: hypothetical protein VFR10_10915 [bacterium]|nr:hypothetical protein [bacterium]
MRPVRALLSIFLLSLSVHASATAATTSPQPTAKQAVRVDSIDDIGRALPEQLDPNVFHCGPIQAKDPVVRQRIESLYKEQWDLQQATFARLREIGESAMNAADFASRQALSKEGAELKETLQLHNMELGLEIAKLNEDAARVAEFEKALDQLRHPEKYMPVSNPDPELRARRLRELGIAK